MSNHIAAKFFNLSYSRIPSKKFIESLDILIERFRRDYPTQDTKDLNNIKIDFGPGETPKKEHTIDKELLLIDADGKYGLKIGNESLSLSVNGYVEYEEMIKRFEQACDNVKEVLDISHFSQVSLRNINTFDGEGNNNFKDIKDSNIWGRQDFSSLSSSFNCSGAATRHEYISNDNFKTLHIASSVVMHGRSYIPQNEWDIWNLRGNIPIINNEKIILLIDLIGTHYQYPLHEPEKKNTVNIFDWDQIKEQLAENHKLVNSVYSDITLAD